MAFDLVNTSYISVKSDGSQSGCLLAVTDANIMTLTASSYVNNINLYLSTNTGSSTTGDAPIYAGSLTSGSVTLTYPSAFLTGVMSSLAGQARYLKIVVYKLTSGKKSNILTTVRSLYQVTTYPVVNPTIPGTVVNGTTINFNYTLDKAQTCTAALYLQPDQVGAFQLVAQSTFAATISGSQSLTVSGAPSYTSCQVYVRLTNACYKSTDSTPTPVNPSINIGSSGLYIGSVTLDPVNPCAPQGPITFSFTATPQIPTSVRVEVQIRSLNETTWTTLASTTTTGGPGSLPTTLASFSPGPYQVRTALFDPDNSSSVDTESDPQSITIFAPPTITASTGSIPSGLLVASVGSLDTTCALQVSVDSGPYTPMVGSFPLFWYPVSVAPHNVSYRVVDCAGQQTDLSTSVSVVQARATSMVATCTRSKLTVCLGYDAPLLVLSPTLQVTVGSGSFVATYDPTASDPPTGSVCFSLPVSGFSGHVGVTSISPGVLGIQLPDVDPGLATSTLLPELSFLDPACISVGDPYLVPLRLGTLVKVVGDQGSRATLFVDGDTVLEGVIQHQEVNQQPMQFFGSYLLNGARIDADTFEGAATFCVPARWTREQIPASMYSACKPRSAVTIKVSDKAYALLLSYENPEIRNGIVLLRRNGDSLSTCQGLLLDLEGVRVLETNYQSDLFVSTNRDKVPTRPPMTLVSIS